MTDNTTALVRAKQTLDDCRPCNIEIATAVREEVEAGRSVRAICLELEEYQVEQHGVAILSAQAIRRRYQESLPVAQNGPPRIRRVQACTRCRELETQIEGMQMRADEIRTVVPILKSIISNKGHYAHVSQEEKVTLGNLIKHINGEK